MNTFEIGEYVLLEGDLYSVCGFSPMAVQPPQLLLEDVASGQIVEVDAALVRKAERTTPLDRPPRKRS